jgi:hypothetical protein
MYVTYNKSSNTGGSTVGIMAIGTNIAGTTFLTEMNAKYNSFDGTAPPPAYSASNPSPAIVYQKSVLVKANYGRFGMVVPQAGTSNSAVKMNAPGAICDIFQSEVNNVGPTLYPLTWLAGQYENQWVCPESMDVYYPPD